MLQMSQMEIDFPSTPSLRPVDRKRPRSPASPSPLERPSKRTSAGRASSTLSFQQHRVLHTNADIHVRSSSLRECKPSDDWVAKTGGLKLDGRESLPESERWNMDITTEGNNNNVLEVVNSDMDVRLFQSARNDDGPPVDVSGPTYTPFPSPPLQRVGHPETSASTTIQRSDIHIRVQPATPSKHGPSQPSMIISSPLSTSTTKSGVWSSPTTQRKPRVTMGPRPDCEKCIMGVKGHWMHVD